MDKPSSKRVTPRLLCVAISVFLFAAIHLADAQQPKKVARIGYLGGANASISAFNLKPFRERLRELGYIEGRISRLNTGIMRENLSGCRNLPSS